MAEQSTHKYRTICTHLISEKLDLKQVFIQKQSESIDLSATNGTFVTKGEIESNFLTTTT